MHFVIGHSEVTYRNVSSKGNLKFMKNIPPLDTDRKNSFLRTLPIMYEDFRIRMSPNRVSSINMVETSGLAGGFSLQNIYQLV